MSKFGNFTEVRHTAVVGDVVASRAVPDREALQNRLREGVASISRARRDVLSADVQITAGDEVQALLATPDGAVSILRGLSDALHPIPLTFGIGYGALSTELPARRRDRRLPLLDGPCFHRARAALESARERGAWAAAGGFARVETPLNALLELVGNLRRGWTEKQGLYSVAARELAQKDVAERFGVSPSVISESLKGARLELVKRGETGIEELLRYFGDLAEVTTDSAERPK